MARIDPVSGLNSASDGFRRVNAALLKCLRSEPASAEGRKALQRALPALPNTVDFTTDQAWQVSEGERSFLQGAHKSCS